MTTAIGLISGGLDSILAATVILEQGIEVVGVSFTTPFFSGQGAQRAAGAVGIPLQVLDITETHLAMLRNPPHGYGNNMNPCIDCHILMLKEAGRVRSGYEGLVLRPLSAHLLPETIPEQEGWVDRERLLAIKGRSRKEQMALARRYHITTYLSPAGGCLLTDPIFSRRLRDLFNNQDPVQIRDIELLKIGRHLRLSPTIKVIVGRHARDNERISEMVAPGDDLLKVEEYPGPLCLIPSGGSMDDIQRAAAVCVRYSDAPEDEEVVVSCNRGGEERRIRARSCPVALPAELMI